MEHVAKYDKALSGPRTITSKTPIKSHYDVDLRILQSFVILYFYVCMREIVHNLTVSTSSYLPVTSWHALKAVSKTIVKWYRCIKKLGIYLPGNKNAVKSNYRTAKKRKLANRYRKRQQETSS